jgi:hypothetical protein
VGFEAENASRAKKMSLTGECLVQSLLKSGRLRWRPTSPNGFADGFVHVDDRPNLHTFSLMAFGAFAKPFRSSEQAATG